MSDLEAENAELRAENARLRARLADVGWIFGLMGTEEPHVARKPAEGLCEFGGDESFAMQLGRESIARRQAVPREVAARALARDQLSRNCQASVGMAMATPIDDHGEGEG